MSGTWGEKRKDKPRILLEILRISFSSSSLQQREKLIGWFDNCLRNFRAAAPGQTDCGGRNMTLSYSLANICFPVVYLCFEFTFRAID